MPDDPEVPAGALAALASHLLEGGQLDDVLHRICQLTVDVIPGAEESSVTILTEHRGITYGATSDLPLAADERQYEGDSGPCLDAARASHVVLVDDFTEDERWPKVLPSMAAQGVRSSLSLPLPVQGETIGALNIYARVPCAFDDAAVGLGRAFASFAAVAVANGRSYADAAEAAHHMRAAMEHRATIEQAKGILMGTLSCDADSAFAYLVQQSQYENRKLRDVAAELVATAGRRVIPPG